MGDVFVVMFLHDIHSTHDMHAIELRLFVKISQMPVCARFGIQVQDAGTGNETVYEIWIKGYLRAGCYIIKKRADPQIMVKLLEKEIANVELSAGRGRGAVGFQFFGKVDFELQRKLIVIFSLLIVFSDLLPGIGERVVGYLQKFRMPADPGDVFCSCLFAVPDSQLDEIGRVFRFLSYQSFIFPIIP